MATVNTERALAEYQKRAGALYNELILRDVAIGELEEQVQSLEAENAQLRGQREQPSALPETASQFG